jgi:hypothetical protein
MYVCIYVYFAHLRGPRGATGLSIKTISGTMRDLANAINCEKCRVNKLRSKHVQGGQSWRSPLQKHYEL